MKEPSEFSKLIPDYVLSALEMLEKAGYEAYIVGGAVRDLILGRAPGDFDITTSATTSEVGYVFRDFKVIPTGILHGTVTVMINDTPIEITTFRVDGEYVDHRHPDDVKFTRSLSEDLRRRDFTVNAMAYSPSKGIVDEHGGLSDIGKKIIRCVGEPEERFTEDALRIMRAVRFAANLGFEIEKGTLEAAVRRAGDLQYVSPERINTELSKLLIKSDGDALKRVLLGECRKILFMVIPELESTEKTPQINDFHSFDVYTHTVYALCSARRDLTLSLTLLLHDIAKPVCLRFDKTGRTHFTGHADVSAEMAERILNSLRFSKKVVRDCVALIKYHELFRDELVKQGEYKRAAGKIIRLTGERLAPELIEVMIADANGKNPEYSESMCDKIRLIGNEVERILEEGSFVTGPSALNVTGGVLMKAGIPRGKILGKILAKLAVLASEFYVDNEQSSLTDMALKIFREDYPVESKETMAANRFKTWSKNTYFDKRTRDELLEIKDKDEIYDRFYKDLEFGTAGLRGVMGAGTNRMNIYVVRRVSYAVAKYIKSFGKEACERGIAVSYDTRLNSELFAKEAAAAFASEGIKTRIFRAPAPVPVLSYTVWSGNFQAGIMITASHNPKQYNGYKVYWEGGVQISPEVAGKVTEIIDSFDDFTKIPDPSFNAEIRKNNLEYFDADTSSRFIDRIAALKCDRDLISNNAKDLCAVYTPLFGSGARYVGRALKHIGFDNVHVVRSQERADGNFPGLTVPNPENPAALELGIKLAKRLSADLVFGTDPDSDRMGAAVRLKDGSYRSLSGNEIGCLFMDYLIGVRKRNGCMPKKAFAVSTIVSTDLAKAIAEANGVEFKSVLTGFKFIGDLITEENKDNFILGFEESYGFLTEGYARDKDGVAASVILCEMALYNKVVLKRSLAEALESIHQKYGYRKETALSIELPGESGHENILKLMAGLRKAGKDVLPGKINAIDDVSIGKKTVFGKNGEISGEEKLDLPEADVLKYYLDEGWFAVRPSGTEPKVKIYVGIKDPVSEENCVAKAQELMNTLKKKAFEIING